MSSWIFILFNSEKWILFWRSGWELLYQLSVGWFVSRPVCPSVGPNRSLKKEIFLSPHRYEKCMEHHLKASSPILKRVKVDNSIIKKLVAYFTGPINPNPNCTCITNSNMDRNIVWNHTLHMQKVAKFYKFTKTS